MTLDVRLIADGGLAAETDPNSHLSATASTVSYAGLINTEQAWYYIDYGTNYFANNASVEYGLHVTSSNTPAGNTAHIHVGFSQLATYGINTTNYEASTLFSVSPTSSTLMLAQSVQRRTTVETSGNAPTSITKTDQYYARTSLLSSLGQYGGINSQVYSDLSRTTLVTSATVVRLTAADSYRYLMLAQGRYTTGTASITGNNSDFTLTAPTAGINLTTGTETDASARLAPYADCIVVTALNVNSADNAATHIAIDEGAGFFGDYTVSGVLNITAFGGTDTLMQYFEMLTVCDAAASSEALNDSQGIAVYWVSATTYKMYIHQMVGGASTFSTTGPTLNTNQPYSFTLSRSGTTLTLKVWNDLVLTNFAGTSQVGTTLTWTGRATTTYRYLMPVASYLNGATSRSSTFTLGGVRILGDTIAATKGAFSWAGTTATISEQPTSITATVGAFSWAGKSSPLSLMIQATKGAFNWAGKTVNLNTGGQVNTTPGAFSWAGKSSPLSHIITATKGAFSWAGKTSLLGSSVTSLRTATLTKWDTATEKEIPDTGLTAVLYMLYDPINLKVYDFSDNTFKASASCVTPQGTMTERVLLNSVGTNLTPGVYDILLSTTGLSGLYQEYLFYYGTTNHLDSNPVRFQDGIEYLGGLTVAENTTLNAVPTSAANATAVWSKTLPL